MLGAVSVSTLVIANVVAETERAVKKHGPFTTDIPRAMLLIGEEYGEAVKVAADLTRAHAIHNREATVQNLEEELRQTAGLCLLMLQNLQEGNYR